MKKDEVFFGENGLTLTSANYIANLAKECYQSIEARLNSVCFYNKSVSLINGENNHVLTNGWTMSDLEHVENDLQKIVKLKALIAWLREAIKAHEAMRNEITNLHFQDFCKLKGIEMTHEGKQEEPRMTEEEYLGTLSVKERNRFFFLETACAVIGNYIHPDGEFSESREQLNKKITRPHIIEGSGRDALIYKFEPSMDCAQIDDYFFKLQAKHREYQAELNGMKNTMKITIEEDAYKKYTSHRDYMKEYNDEYTRIYNEMREYQSQEMNRIWKLRIIIPNDLKDAYDEVNSLGK